MGSGSISERPLIPLSGINYFKQNGRSEIEPLPFECLETSPGYVLLYGGNGRCLTWIIYPSMSPNSLRSISMISALGLSDRMIFSPVIFSAIRV